MGPRRTTLALTLLALGLLVASAGTAVASSDRAGPSRPTAGRGSDVVTGASSDHVHGGHDGTNGHGGQTAVSHTSTYPSQNGHSTGGDATGGDVTGTSVDIPSAPVQAPAATASGPAPDAVAPAPIVLTALEAFAPVSGSTGVDFAALAAPDDGALPAVAAPVADVAAEVAAPVAEVAVPVAEVAVPVAEFAVPVAEAAVPANEPSLAGIPSLGSIGSLATVAPNAPSSARALLATDTGRSVAVLLALLAAIVLFLSIHRRVDRSDPKLASARTGPDVARFR